MKLCVYNVCYDVTLVFSCFFIPSANIVSFEFPTRHFSRKCKCNNLWLDNLNLDRSQNCKIVVLLIEAIQTISSLFIFFIFFIFFFDEKISRAQKHVTPRSLCAREKLLSLLFSISLFLFCQLISLVTCFCAREIFSSKSK